MPCPLPILISTPPEQIAAELRRLQNLRHGEVEVWHRIVPETKTVEYTIGTYEDITPGIVSQADRRAYRAKACKFCRPTSIRWRMDWCWTDFAFRIPIMRASRHPSGSRKSSVV